MEYNRGKVIDFFVTEINAGRIEFPDVRKTLKQTGIEDDEIKIVTTQVDKEVRRFATLKATRSKGKGQFYGGLILCGAGIILTAGTYFNLFNSGGFVLLAYGPIFGGIILALSGRSKMRLK